MTWITCTIMVTLFVTLGVIMLYWTEINLVSMKPFNKEFTCALRGFWSIIVILVHVPLAFQNQLQDMAGSFAYIGVTFFFMTSAYGLKISYSKQETGVFWRKRLPKLLVPMFVVNVVKMLLYKELIFWGLFAINGWVQWLLYCYLAFWFAYTMNLRCKDLFICACVVLLSLYWFIMGSGVGWPTEVYGFIWGILLANNVERLEGKLTMKSYITQGVILFVISVIFGVFYLKYKPVVFWGNYLLKILLGVSLILLLLWFTKGIKIGNRANLFLGRISYETYLIHGAVMTVVASVRPDLESSVFIVVSIVGTVILAAISHEIGECILKRIKL